MKPNIMLLSVVSDSSPFFSILSTTEILTEHLTVAMFFNVPFLLTTILVYTILPELRNIHGKSLVCYLCGLVVGYITLGLIKLNENEHHFEAKLCRALAYSTYIAFLFAFFWSNVISFDLWRSFWFVHFYWKSNLVLDFDGHNLIVSSKL